MTANEEKSIILDESVKTEKLTDEKATVSSPLSDTKIAEMEQLDIDTSRKHKPISTTALSSFARNATNNDNINSDKYENCVLLLINSEHKVCLHDPTGTTNGVNKEDKK